MVDKDLPLPEPGPNREVAEEVINRALAHSLVINIDQVSIPKTIQKLKEYRSTHGLADRVSISTPWDETTSEQNRSHGTDPEELRLQMNRSIDEAFSELVGMEQAKEVVRGFAGIGFLNRLDNSGLEENRPGVTSHLVITGSPGTGKSTIARLVGQLYQQLGLLTNGELHEVSRADLVQKYVGHTEARTNEMIDQARGGVLLVDEAYTLNNSERDDFGKAALQQIQKAAEDQRQDLVIILALSLIHI